MNFRLNALAALAAIVLSACGGGSDDDGRGSDDDRAGDDALSASALPAPPALPPAQVPSEVNTFTCRNVSVDAQPIDTVFVPAGAACALAGTRLVGSIKLERGARLDARGVRVNGDLQGEGAASVVLAGASTIGGSVQLVHGSSAIIDGARISGDLQLFANSGALTARNNLVGGSIQVMDNRGGVTLSTNSANGNLQCKQNVPPPTGSGNRAASKEDQCARL